MTEKTYRQGQWTPGMSGNPSGRPKTPTHVKEMLGALTEKAVRALEDALDGDDQKLRLTAAVEVLNRNLGKPHTTASVEVASTTDMYLASLQALNEAVKEPVSVNTPIIDATPVAKALTLPPTTLAALTAAVADNDSDDSGEDHE